MDRASGSGVFARDPDALLDLIELELNDNILKQLENHAVCNVCKQYLDAHFKWQEDLSQDDLCSSYQMINYCENTLDKWQFQTLQKQIKDAKESVRQRTAWRIEGTLRELSLIHISWLDSSTESGHVMCQCVYVRRDAGLLNALKRPAG